MIRTNTAVIARRQSILGALVALLTLLALLSLAGCGGLGNPVAHGGVDFSIAATPGSQTVIAGHGAEFTFAVSPAAEAGALSFTVNGLPANVQASFEPPIVAPLGTAVLNISTNETTPAGTSQITITASDASGSQKVNVSLTVTPVADFTLSASPNSQAVVAGNSADYNVNVNFGSNAAHTVSLNVLGLPLGVTASFNPSTVTGTGSTTLTVSSSGSAIPSSALLTISATDTSGTYTVPVYFIVTPADFFLTQSLDSIAVNAGGTVTDSLTVSLLASAHGSPSIGLSVSGAPTGMTVSFAPSTIVGAGSSTLTIATDASIAPGDYVLSIQGSDATGENTITLPVTVAFGNSSADFFLSASPQTIEVTAGGSANFTINELTTSGPLPTITFNSVTGVIQGVTANITQNGPADTYLLSITTDSSLSGQQISLTVTANGPSGSQSLEVTLVIDPMPVVDPTPDPNPTPDPITTPTPDPFPTPDPGPTPDPFPTPDPGY